MDASDGLRWARYFGIDHQPVRIVVIIRILPDDPSTSSGAVVEVELCLRVLTQRVPVYSIYKRPFPGRFIQVDYF